MRLLSFMQLAECNPEMSFELIQSELQLPEEEVEAFIIEGIHLNMFLFVLSWEKCNPRIPKG